jgi:WD40 repeat protein
MKVTALLPAVLIAAALAAPAQDTSDVLWAKDSFSPLRAFLDSADEWHFYQAAVHWHWNDSLLIASDLVRGIHRVFEIDAYRGIGLRELEGFRGKGIYALSRDSGIVFTYQPPFAKARYPSGEIVDSFPAWPPPGYRDAALNAATNQLLVWTEAPDDNRLWLYSLDSYQLIDTIPIPRPLRYGTTNWQPGEHRLAYESMSWSTDARYMALGLLERWSDRDQRGYPVPREAYQTWVLDIPNRRVLRKVADGLWGALKNTPDHRFYVTTAGMSWLIFDTDFNHLQTINSPLSAFDISPDGRYVAGGPGSSGNTRIWEIESGQLLHWYQRGGASNVRYSPSGAYIKTHSEGSIAVLRNVVLSSVGEPTQPFPVLRPNPAGGTVLLGPVLPGLPTLIELADLRGRVLARLYEGIPATATIELSVASLPVGTYFLRLVNGSSVTTYHLLKEQ